MKPMKWKAVAAEAKLLLIGIPVLIWTMLPIYHLILFAISRAGAGMARPSRCWVVWVC
jgi:multiple sugar transport system permease protein